MSGENLEKNPKDAGCGFGKVTRERIDNLEKTFDDFRTHDFHSLRKAVENIRDNLLRRVPWSVTVLITLLTSLCVGLLVFAAVRTM